MTYRKVGPVVHTKLGYFCLMPEDEVGAHVLLRHTDAMLAEVKRAAKLLPAVGAKALVVGAHIGTVAIPLSTCCEELVAIEPNPRAFEVLTLNAAMNGCENLVLANFAANDKEEMLDFVVEYVNSGGSKRKPAREMAHQGRTEAIQVPSARLDDALAGREFDLVFMDCEGSEYFAFHGMQRIFQRAKALIVEFIPRHVTEVAGVTIADFLWPIQDHFNDLFVPSTGRRGGRSFFQDLLEGVSENGDSGVVFRKS